MDIDYLPTKVTGLGAPLGLMSAPGRRRALEIDLDELRQVHRCTMLVCLVGDQELCHLRIPDLAERAQACGIELVRLAIENFSTPDSIEDIIPVVQRIIMAGKSGSVVVIHCWAGLGRSGLIAACCLTTLGFSASEAIETVRRYRPLAIETSDQEKCVGEFETLWQSRGTWPT